MLFAAGIFGSAAMLLWGLAALVPLLLHLWNRNQHTETPWAAMEFLLAAVQQQARRMRLQQLLLLLLRMAIPVVLALALADPIWQWLPSVGTSRGTRPPHHHLLVIDNSYSMGYLVDSETRLDQAQRLARDIINSSQQGDGFTLLSMGVPAQIVVRSPIFSPEDISTEVSAIQLMDTVADLRSTMDFVKQTVKAAQTEHPRLKNHQVYFFSDLGANTWRATEQPVVRQTINDVAAMAEFVTIDVAAESTKNAGISHVVRDGVSATMSRPITWRVTVNDFTGNAGGEKSLAMYIDGQLASRQTIQLPNRGQTTTAFHYQFDTPGQHRVEFRLADDLLGADNHHYEVVDSREQIQVLCVSGKPGAARNVAMALSPTRDGEIQSREVLEYRLSDIDLQDFDCVFFCNVGRFTSDRTTRLREYLQRGGSAVFFLGDQIQAENYNDMLAKFSGDKPSLLPARLGQLSPPGSYLFDPRDYQHPIIRPFRGQERAGLLTTPVWRYFRLEADKESTANVALAFANGDPAIIEQTIGSGRVILVATAASEQSVTRQSGRLSPWTAWSAWPSFPPIVQEMLVSALSAHDENRNRLVGETLGDLLSTSTTSRFVSLSQQSEGQESSHRVPIADAGNAQTWSFDRTYQGGFYTATVVGDDNNMSRFALNVTINDESDLERFPLENLPNQFQHRSIKGPEASTGDVTSATPLFRMMLGLLLALMFAESFVAWYMGNARI